MTKKSTKPKTAYVTVDEVRTINQDVLDIWMISDLLKKCLDKTGNLEAIAFSDALNNRLERLSDMMEPIVNDVNRELWAKKAA